MSALLYHGGMSTKSISLVAYSLAVMLMMTGCQPVATNPAVGQSAVQAARKAGPSAFSPLEQLNLPLIPEPQEVKPGAGLCQINRPIALVVASDAPQEDRFAAQYFAGCLKRDFGLEAQVSDDSKGKLPVTINRGGKWPAEGYALAIASNGIDIGAADAAGVYYALTTLRQCLRKQDGVVVAPCLSIRDWPDLKYRAIHYDTKHHQPTKEYVESFIKEMASYKVNVLVWEWEDKFAYPQTPEVGAPGAFSMEQMQAFTKLAAQHHIQIVPLVQGLGHVSFILKHPKYRHLREISASNWEFCPLRDESYELLFKLWDQAIEATPGSTFLHIGSDETYELGAGETCGCKAKAAEIGKDGLMQMFIRRCNEHVKSKGRTMISWGGDWKPNSWQQPPKEIVFTDRSDLEFLKGAKQAGYQFWVYAPNPGITPLFLPQFPWVKRSMWRGEAPENLEGVFRETGLSIAKAGAAKVVEGSITTSWDDAGLADQCWIPRFICAADYSWKAQGRDIDTFARRYFANYFGPDAKDLPELFQILQESACFYDDTFQRRVWHWGDIGKIHLPDFPRGDLEISNYWRGRYAKLLDKALQERKALDKAIGLIDENLGRGILHRYDVEIMRSVAVLMKQNVDTILMLAELENMITDASDSHFNDRQASLKCLKQAQEMIQKNLDERNKAYNDLVALWEKTRLPKGMSLPGKPYVFARDRARHFANRTPDMSYLIYDLQLLDIEGYLARLKEYTAQYEKDINR